MGVEETLSYMDFPREHWLRIRTTNALERILKEVRRRTRVVGAFPDGQSALMLVCARLRYVVSTEWGEKMYLNMKLMVRELEETNVNTAIPVGVSGGNRYFRDYLFENVYLRLTETQRAEILRLWRDEDVDLKKSERVARQAAKMFQKYIRTIQNIAATEEQEQEEGFRRHGGSTALHR